MLAAALALGVVLSELAMPDVDAVELVQWLREQLPRAFLVVMAERPDPAAATRFDGMLPKPVQPAALADVLNRVASRRCSCGGMKDD